MEPNAFAGCATETEVVRHVREWLCALPPQERDCLPQECRCLADEEDLDVGALAFSVAMAKLDARLAPDVRAALARLDAHLSAAATRVAWIQAYRTSFTKLPSRRAART